jgi:hypothetical protein
VNAAWVTPAVTLAAAAPAAAAASATTLAVTLSSYYGVFTTVAPLGALYWTYPTIWVRNTGRVAATGLVVACTYPSDWIGVSARTPSWDRPLNSGWTAHSVVHPLDDTVTLYYQYVSLDAGSSSSIFSPGYRLWWKRPGTDPVTMTLSSHEYPVVAGTLARVDAPAS